VFPFTVLAVTDGTNRPALGKLSRIALVSGAAAIAMNLLLGAAGLNHSYYQAGDIQGLGGEHDVSLLAGAVTAASLGMTAVGRWAPVSAIGAIATIATGVRSTLPGLLLAALARISRAGARGRTLFVVAVAVVAVYASGVANVVVDRFAHGQQTGEFASLSTFGSGRGAIYATAIHAWWSSSPVDWFFGTGLRTLPGIEDRALGESLVGHSDVVEVGVQTGLIGLVGLILMWWTLIARARSKLPLLVLVPFSLFNGILEYGAPLVVALLLTARSDGGAAELDGGGEPRAAPWHDSS
jgi:O-Antigen ligase